MTRRPQFRRAEAFGSRPGPTARAYVACAAEPRLAAGLGHWVAVPSLPRNSTPETPTKSTKASSVSSLRVRSRSWQLIRSRASSSNRSFFSSCSSFVRPDATPPSPTQTLLPTRRRAQTPSRLVPSRPPEGLALMASSTVPRSFEGRSSQRAFDILFEVWAAPSPCGLGSRSIARAEGARATEPRDAGLGPDG
jgi:hypothetical protein